MNDTKQALEAVVELVEKATPGEWSICDGPAGYAHRIYSEAMPEELAVVCDVTHGKDASLVTAAVNLIRTHGPALIAALEDARRWRKLRELSGADGAKLDQLADEPIDAMAAGGDQPEPPQ